jgi:ABC-type tungstate transport system substrate-binding protein
MRLALAATLATIALAPNAAVACAVCFTGRSDETRIAFMLTTVLMTALPLLLIGSLIWWLLRRAQQIQREQESDTAR